MKTCRVCSTTLPLEAFKPDGRRPGCTENICKKCHNKASSAARKANWETYLEKNRKRQALSRHRWREAEAITRLLRIYQLTKDDYNALLAQQGGVCAICQRPETVCTSKGIVKALCVDHDHLTGQVRGLLCSACNSGIGNFEDNLEYMTRAIEYLKRAIKQRKIKQLELFE